MPMEAKVTPQTTATAAGFSTVGAAYILVAAIIFSLHSYVVAEAKAALTPWDIGFARWLMGGSMILLVAKLFKIKGIWGEHRLLLITRGIASTLSYICLVISLQLLPISEATVIFFSCPMFTAITGSWINKQKVGLRDWIFILGGFLGVVLVLHPQDGHMHLGAGHVLAMVASFLSGISIAMIRRLATDNHPFTLYLYFCVLGSIISLTPASQTLGRAWMDWPVMWSLLAAAITGSVGQVLLNKGLKSELPAHTGAVLLSSQVVFTTLLGVILLHEPFTWYLVLGSIMVLGCGALLSRRKKAAGARG